jgi:cob(I)alamin adenosyltransferase
LKIYTRAGDRGLTALIGGERVRKDHPRIEAYGTVDELNSAIGLARALWTDCPVDDELQQIQQDLFSLGSYLASKSDAFTPPPDERVTAIEAAIDRMVDELPPLKNFILPGGSPAAAALHVARTICRRAERCIVALSAIAENREDGVVYLNRLSDFLFVAARFANHRLDIPDVPWKK